MSRAAFDIAGLLQQAARLGRTQAELSKATQRATGTLRRRMPVAARRDIQQEYNLKAGRINSGLRASPIERGVELIGSGRGVGLIEFGGKWRGPRSPGATAQVRRDEGVTLYPGQFIATLLGGNRQIVSRTGSPRRMTQGRYAGKVRQPLTVEYGPQVAQMLIRRDRLDRLRDVQADILRAEFQRLLGAR